MTTPLRVVFTCKDQHIAEYYEKCFGAWFEREVKYLLPSLDQNEPVRVPYWPHNLDFTGLISEYANLVWKPRMLCEARIQEYYDYTVNEIGRRQVIYEEDGTPKLLIPEVTVVERVDR